MRRRFKDVRPHVINEMGERIFAAKSGHAQSHVLDGCTGSLSVNQISEKQKRWQFMSRCIFSMAAWALYIQVLYRWLASEGDNASSLTEVESCWTRVMAAWVSKTPRWTTQGVWLINHTPSTSKIIADFYSISTWLQYFSGFFAAISFHQVMWRWEKRREKILIPLSIIYFAWWQTHSGNCSWLSLHCRLSTSMHWKYI